MKFASLNLKRQGEVFSCGNQETPLFCSKIFRMDDYLKSKLPEVAALCKKHKVKAAYVFGSVLTEHFNASSDIDLLVYFHKVPFMGYADNLFSLEESLAKLLGRKVDIVPGHTLSNPYFIAAVNRTKLPLYE